jgi:hypothetical protein
MYVIKFFVSEENVRAIFWRKLPLAPEAGMRVFKRSKNDFV